MTEEEKLRRIFYFVDAGTPTLKEWAHIESNYYVIYVVAVYIFLLQFFMNMIFSFQLQASFSSITFAKGQKYINSCRSRYILLVFMSF